MGFQKRVLPARALRTARTQVVAAVAALLAGLHGTANAIEIDTGNEDAAVRWDNTVRYNLGRRMEGQDPAIIGGPNYDDGDRNFRKGAIVTNRIDLLSEFDYVFKKRYGFRVSGAAWYDNAYAGGFDNTSLATSNHLVNGKPAFGLSPASARYFEGPSGELLDAFVFGTFDMGSMPLSLRVGQHTVTWGESLLGGGAIHGIAYGQSPLDQAKGLATPGIEAKELYRPLNQVSGTLQVTPELAVSGQYYLGWDTTRLPESGTYLGFADFYLKGGESLILAPGVRALRGADITPDKRGDWGLSARWSPQWLDGTAGVYYRNFTDKIPTVIVKAAPPTQYVYDWGSNIDLFGLSLAKQVAGVSLGAELNWRHNMPLNSDTVSVLQASSLPAPGETLAARGNTVHGVLNALGAIGATPLFGSATYAAELTWNRWLSVSQGAQYFKGRAGYTGIDRVTKDFFGLALNFSPTWYQVFPGADLSMPLSYSIGLSGNSAVSSGGNEGAGSYSVGLGLDVYARYRFDLKYVDYFAKSTLNAAGVITTPNGTSALLSDRGALFFTFKTTF